MQELVTRYGEKVAQAIVDYKLSTPEIMSDEVRWHPDAPEVEAGYCTCYSIRLLLKSSSNFMQRLLCRKQDSSGSWIRKARKRSRRTG